MHRSSKSLAPFALEPLGERPPRSRQRSGPPWLACLVALGVGGGCGGGARSSPPQTPEPPRTSSPASRAPGPATPAPSSPSPRLLAESPRSPTGVGDRCGPFECHGFDTGADALGFVLADGPVALGVGEAHALAGTEHLASTAQRFSEQLLPSLQGLASHLIVELLNPDPRCKPATEQVRRAQQPVTAPQSQQNQSDYVALGTHARALGIEPFVLSPTCDEFRAIADAGDSAIDAMLTTIARVTSRMLRGALAKNRADGRAALVVGYGGALHNDIAPAEAKLGWSYGPDLVAFTGGRYTELDLVVREFIKDTDAWRALPWYAHFDAERDATRWLVMRTAAHRYALFFPRTDPAAHDAAAQ